MSIPPAFIQELLSRVDVVDVVGRYVQLKKGGANFMGLCPFHGEKSPSFSVSPTKQFYHCFGCGANGNAIGFLIEHTGMGFVEAVKDLAQQTGLVVPEEESSPQERAQAAQQRQRQSSLTEVLEKAAQAYSKQLKGSPCAVAYLKGRGLSGEVARTFGLGYAPPGWRHLAGVFPDYQTALLVESGLVIAPDEGSVETPNASAAQAGVAGTAGAEARRYDRFRDRIMFPIRNVKGETVGFGGRVLDHGEPKYLNSPETPVFSKGRELYGLFEARTAIRLAGYALVTEGYMDVVALAQLGFGNAVATLGTACTAEHVHKLFRFTDSVVFSFDGDGAGRRAARKALDAALPLAGDTRSVKFLFLPPEHDPDSFVRANGSEAFAECVRQAVPLSRFLLDAASADCDLGSAEGRARMAAQARPLWSGLPDGALKRQLLGELADLINLDSQDLHQLWQHSAKLWSQPRQPTSDSGKRTSRPPRGEANGTGDGGRDRVSARGLAWKNPYHETGPILRSIQKGGRRRGLTSRADRAVGLLLANPKAWEQLSSDDHAMLAHLSPPHGPLFGWLEAQLLEHGTQPWAALREGLRGHPHETFALGQVEQAMSPEEPNPESGELLDVMQRLRMDEWQRECTILSALAATDADARHRLQAVYALISAQKNTAL